MNVKFVHIDFPLFLSFLKECKNVVTIHKRREPTILRRIPTEKSDQKR